MCYLRARTRHRDTTSSPRELTEQLAAHPERRGLGAAYLQNDPDVAATGDDITGRMLAAVIRCLRSGHDSNARGRLSARLLVFA